MSNLTAREKRYLDNAVIFAASKLIFKRLEESFPVKVLEDIADTTSGGTPSRGSVTYYGGDIPWIKSGELNDGVIETVEERITEIGLSNSSAKIFPKGTLVIALYGATVGKTGILGIDAATNQAVCAVFPKSNDVSVRYLHWFFRNKREDFLDSSFGGAQPNISQRLLRSTEIPIPAPFIQEAICNFLDTIEANKKGNNIALPTLPGLLNGIERIVGRIEELAGKVEEARRLRAAAAGETNQLVTSLSRTIFDNANWPEVPLFELLTQDTRNGIGRKPSDEPIGVPILRISAGTSRSDAIVDETDHKYIEVTERELEAYTLEKDDLLACRFNGNLRFVGRFSLYQGFSNQVQVYPDKLIRFRVDKSKVMPEYVRIAANSPKVRGVIEGFCATTAGNLGISASNLKTVTIPVPPLNTQKQIVELVDQMHTKVNILTKLQTSTQYEIDALLPSILDKAFKGEL